MAPVLVQANRHVACQGQLDEVQTIVVEHGAADMPVDLGVNSQLSCRVDLLFDRSLWHSL